MSGSSGRNAVIIHAVQLLELVNKPGWHSYAEVRSLFDCTRKTAYRWVVALQQAGMPIEFYEENERVRHFKLMHRPAITAGELIVFMDFPSVRGR